MGCSSSKKNPDRDDPSTYRDMSVFEDHPVIFVTGVPGTGNETVADTITKMTGYYLIKPADLIRREARRDTERGEQVHQKLTEGVEITEQQTVNLIKEEMLKNREAQGFVLLDFPKNAKMSKIFQKQVKAPEKIVSLSMNEQAATARLQSKLSELGRPESEISSAKHMVEEAADNIKNMRKRFYGQSLTLQNDESNAGHLAETLRAALVDYLKPSEPALRQKASIMYNPSGLNVPEGAMNRPFAKQSGVTIIPAHNLVQNAQSYLNDGITDGRHLAQDCVYTVLGVYLENQHGQDIRLNEINDLNNKNIMYM